MINLIMAHYAVAKSNEPRKNGQYQDGNSKNVKDIEFSELFVNGLF
jgi:hypothetical protein